jgi:FkbM family methyltransferase
MRRPLLVRVLPDRLKTRAFQRFYSPFNEIWRPLYDSATLRLAPALSMELLPGDIISDPIAMTGLWRLPFSRRLLHLARPGGLMVDVGANLGYFSLLWAGANQDNRGIAIEASPRNVEMLRRNVARNHFGDRIAVIPCAAGRAAGTLLFDAGPAAQTGWGTVVSEPGPKTIPISTIRVDDAIDANAEIALLKIDTQGSDTWVLYGCEDLLRRRRVREVWFEQNGPRMRALGIGETDAVQFLKGLGYHPRPQSRTDGELVEWSATRAADGR